jgi:hypothetical protein
MGEQNRRRPEPVEFGRLSVWRDSAGLDDKQAREHAARLELRPKVRLRRATIT